MTNRPVVRMAAITLMVAMVSHVAIAGWSVAPVGGALDNANFAQKTFSRTFSSGYRKGDIPH